MIGLIGPRDSVELVLKVAQEMHAKDYILPRVYADINEAPGLAAELKDICQVLLFTGCAPYMLSGNGEAWLDEYVDFIPHGGVDLYRTISVLLLLPRFRTSFPSLSIDSIDLSDGKEAFGELGLSVPVHIIPLTRGGKVDTDYIANEHIRLFRSGQVSYCLTCVGSVYDTLQKNNIPTTRIVHSRIVIKESLEKARLALYLSRAEASQVAAFVLRIKSKTGRGKMKSPRPILLAAARKCERITDGRIVRETKNEVVVLATRGAAERCVKSGSLPGAVVPKHLSSLVTFGIGYGTSASIAEEKGRRAAESAVAGAELVSVLKPDQVKRQRSENFQVAKQFKISPSIARRLINVFASLDPENFTATELAEAYRLSPRSARRLIGLLRKQKLVHECGIEKSDGPGRPTRAYRIGLSRLAELLPDNRAVR